MRQSTETQIVLITHNIRSSYNIGALLRTADGLGISEMIISGYSPYPLSTYDARLPHEAAKVHRSIRKTALGAEETVAWRRIENLPNELDTLRRNGFYIVALEQSMHAQPLPAFKPPQKIALIVGNELSGIEHNLLEIVDTIVEIPMQGGKESYNVSIAAAMALYHSRFRCR